MTSLGLSCKLLSSRQSLLVLKKYSTCRPFIYYNFSTLTNTTPNALSSYTSSLNLVQRAYSNSSSSPTTTIPTTTTTSSCSWIPSTIRPHKDKSLLELLNSIFVFQLCAYPKLVDVTPTILSAAQKLGLTAFFYAIVKQTFFKHFCGGETLEEVVPTMKKFENVGIGSILDLAMEADLDTAAELTLEQSKQNAENIKKLMVQSIDIASHQDKSFIAVKVTAFVPPPVLLKWTNTLDLLKAVFKKVDSNNDGFLSHEEFCNMMKSFNNTDLNQSSKLFDSIIVNQSEKMNVDVNGNQAVDWIDISDALSAFNTINRDFLIKETLHNAKSEKKYLSSMDDFLVIDSVMQEILELCQYGKDKRVRIMIDAEQTYFQRAIDDVTLFLCKQINHLNGDIGPYVSNTYQMYLKDSLNRLKMDIERAERNKYGLGVKIVRGAYMSSERERADAIHILSPVHDTIQETHTSYNSAIDFLISKLSEYRSNSPDVKPLTFVVASHNKKSAQRAVEAMKKNSVPAADGTVGFAQLMGMQDSTTHFLAQNGFKSYKYIPYGPIHVTIPYLLRRAEENSSILGENVLEDKTKFVNELKTRLRISK